MLQVPKSTLPARTQRIMRLSDALKAKRIKPAPKGSYMRGGFEKLDPARELNAALAGADEAYGLFATEKLVELRDAIAAGVDGHDPALAQIIRDIPLPELWGPDDPRDIEDPYGATMRAIEESMRAHYAKIGGHIVPRQGGAS